MHVCMYVCMDGCFYIYIYIYVYMHLYIYIYMHHELFSVVHDATAVSTKVAAPAGVSDGE